MGWLSFSNGIPNWMHPTSVPAILDDTWGVTATLNLAHFCVIKNYPAILGSSVKGKMKALKHLIVLKPFLFWNRVSLLHFLKLDFSSWPFLNRKTPIETGCPWGMRPWSRWFLLWFMDQDTLRCTLWHPLMVCLIPIDGLPDNHVALYCAGMCHMWLACFQYGLFPPHHRLRWPLACSWLAEAL